MRKKSLALILTLGLLLSSFALLIPVSAEQEPEYGEISKTYDGWIEYLGTVVTNGYFATTTSGGSRDPKVINDGLVLPADNANRRHQFDSYVYGKSAVDEYIGYEFEKAYTVKSLMYQSGVANSSGGYFEGGFVVQAKIDDAWVDVDSDAGTVYSTSTVYSETEFPSYRQYTVNLSEPVVCTGIRIFGTAGGVQHFFSCSELKVLATGIPAGEGGYVENLSSPIISHYNSGTIGKLVTTSGGSRWLSTIKDGVMAPSASSSLKLGYDNYIASNTAREQDYIGYEFPQSFVVEHLVYQQSGVGAGGGFFANGVRVQALVNGEWTDVASDAADVYPVTTDYTAFKNFETYTITLKAPVACDGIRLAGTPGGTKYYIGCAEMKVGTTEASGIALRGAQNTQAKAGVQDIRFVSTVDTLNCSEIGYYITITAPGMETMRIKQALHTVYGEITGSCGNYTAKQLGGGYIVAFTIKNVPTDLGQITFEVTPYWIDGYGTHYDVAGTFVYENGNCITQ